MNFKSMNLLGRNQYSSYIVCIRWCPGRIPLLFSGRYDEGWSQLNGELACQLADQPRSGFCHLWWDSLLFAPGPPFRKDFASRTPRECNLAPGKVGSPWSLQLMQPCRAARTLVALWSPGLGLDPNPPSPFPELLNVLGKIMSVSSQLTYIILLPLVFSYGLCL